MPAAPHTYTPDDRMGSLIVDHYELIQVMSRFGIAVGFGDKSIQTVCRENHVDCPTFLAVVNYVITGHVNEEDLERVSLSSLMHYLSQAHAYFLQYFLPAIRRKLLEGMEFRTSDVSFLIIRFFDDYMHEVRRHMSYEEQAVFPHIESLLRGVLPDGFRIATYSDHHEQVGDKLYELKKLIIRYCPECVDVNLLNDALYDIYRCEEELNSHCLIENHILAPAIRLLEEKIAASSTKE